MEQIGTYKYLSCEVPQRSATYVEKKLDIRFRLIYGTTTRTLRKKLSKETLLKLHKVTADPSLLYGCKNWTIRVDHERDRSSTDVTFETGCGLRTFTSETK